MLRAKLAVLLARPFWPWVVCAIAILLAAPTLGAGFMLDDYSIQLIMRSEWRGYGGPRGAWDLFRFHGGDPEALRAMMQAGVWPWWTSGDLKLAFFRPLSSLWHAFDYRVLARSPWIMHAESVALLGAGALAAARLYRRVLGATWVAGLAALFYAVDDAHSLPVVWISNRNALTAAVLGLWAVILHDEARRSGARRAAVLAPSMFALALLAGEIALGAAAYVVSYELFLSEGTRKEKLRALAPYLLGLLAYVVAYKLGGYGARGSAMYIDPATQPLSFLFAAAVRLPQLLLSQMAFPPADVWMAVPPASVPSMMAAVLVALAVLTLLFAGALGERREARFFTVGMVLSLVPACGTLPNDRLLLLSGFGAFGLSAMMVERAFGLAAPPARRGTLRALAMGLMVAHLVLAAPLLPLRSMFFSSRFRSLGERAEASLPRGMPKGATMVVISAPDSLVTNYAIAMRTIRGDEVPERMRVLGVPLEGEQRVLRLDDRTLSMTLKAGFLADPLGPLFRAGGFTAGERIDVGGMAAEVVSVLPDGRAEEVRFRFERPLDDPSYVWIRWANGRFVPASPPAIGEAATFPAIDFMRVLSGDG